MTMTPTQLECLNVLRVIRSKIEAIRAGDVDLTDWNDPDIRYTAVACAYFVELTLLIETGHPEFN